MFLNQILTPFASRAFTVRALEVTVFVFFVCAYAPTPYYVVFVNDMREYKTRHPDIYDLAMKKPRLFGRTDIIKML